MKVLINPTYSFLEDFLKEIPSRFEKEGTVIYEGRNLIKVIEHQGVLLNVKRYCIPIFINRIAYTFFRKPKGERAFLYPSYLKERGIETPTPIAYIELSSFGLISYSYFISIHDAEKSTLYWIEEASAEEYIPIAQSLAEFTADLHEKGIYHLDYSPGNILYEKDEKGRFQFSLVDINRMQFGPVSVEKGCKNFARLWGNTHFFTLLAKAYAKARGADVEMCVDTVLKARDKFWKRRDCENLHS